MEVLITPDTKVGVNESEFTFQRQTYVYRGQRWAGLVKLAPMKKEFARFWIAFFLSLNGVQGTFLLGDPDGAEPLGRAVGNPRVRGANQQGSELVTDGWTPNTVGILLARDWIQVGNYAAVVLNDVNSNAAGQATLDVWPRLRSSPSDNAVITTRNVRVLMRMETNTQGRWKSNVEGFYPDLSFSCVEVV